MNYWLVKTEPEEYSWETFQKEGKARWDNIRNFMARKNLKTMKLGDRALFYHTGKEKSVIGIAKVVTEAYPDPADKEWACVDLSPVKILKKPVSLADIKAQKKLKEIALVKQPRLSVQPLDKESYEFILGMSDT